MVLLEMSALDREIQVLRDHLQGEDDDLRREYANRRRPGRAAKVNANLIHLLRGEPYRLPSDELDPPYGLEHTTPMLGIAVGVIVGIPLLSVLGFVAWAILR